MAAPNDFKEMAGSFNTMDTIKVISSLSRQLEPLKGRRKAIGCFGEGDTKIGSCLARGPVGTGIGLGERVCDEVYLLASLARKAFVQVYAFDSRGVVPLGQEGFTEPDQSLELQVPTRTLRVAPGPGSNSPAPRRLAPTPPDPLTGWETCHSPPSSPGTTCCGSKPLPTPGPCLRRGAKSGSLSSRLLRRGVRAAPAARRTAPRFRSSA